LAALASVACGREPLELASEGPGAGPAASGIAGANGLGAASGTTGAAGAIGTAGAASATGDAGAAGGVAGQGQGIDAPRAPCQPGTRQCRGGAGEICDGVGAWQPAPELACDAAPSCPANAGAGVSACGPEREDCCTTIELSGGTFFRSYDGVSCPGGPGAPIPGPACYTSATSPATVSAVRLDKYLVTVGRFRRFLDALMAGWMPQPGDGRHTHLNGGQGLADSNAPGQFETGWDPSWNSELPTTLNDWTPQLTFDSTGGTWTRMAGDGEELPITAMTWAQAYAFCIWDGGFLPSEAEWNLAAAGGSEQRVYPWSSPPSSTLLDCAHAAHGSDASFAPDCRLYAPLAVGSKSPLGDARWGHVDLAGDAAEVVLDWLADYVSPCVDCAELEEVPSSVFTPLRVMRGLMRFAPTDGAGLLTSLRDGIAMGAAEASVGVRCARPALGD
jgi:formylglycine-generating enzyme required for sulfatase activity